ncbi:predicted protein [Phaeodactylum tricornutum CCAP 1055/1]|uniref:DUF6824 domain-containing protein n=1 Tax=Phaeodactylum tricornutum (strain CCAP 1055/1) TaxID=556484 RepID=B7G3V0_PHATC|nr:predicted protein [Phaeodactylum tricornutum CCAP 1055/1]EEC46715.1 predicted protein [Phaeodactylum tricornutum CCAP 1055/1]|eukprot:XP_002181501.1 predicted protein [Phaeodactylum tricornutum CCAP 1055/1]
MVAVRSARSATVTEPQDRDCVLTTVTTGDTEDSTTSSASTSNTTTTPTDRLLRDVLQLHAVIHHLGRTSPSVATAFATPNDDDDDKKPNTADPNHKNKTLDDDDHLSTLASRIYRLIVDGKPYELAGLKDVPKPFFRSPGRCLARDGAMRYQVLSERDAHAAIVVLLRHEFQRQDLVGWEQQAPYKDFRTAMTSSTTATVGIVPDPKDAIVLNVADGNGDKLYESQGGNKAIFNLASQLVTSYTNDSEKRVEAALAIMKGLREAEVIEEDKESKTTTVVASNTSRYLLRTPRNDDTITWSILDAAAAAEFTVIFVLEIFLEKGIHLLPPGEVLGSAVALDKTMVKPSTEPVPDPTDYDVLFGRGGMTNSHPGNRRFRDVIALHRPDYIRAIKMDKPGVARKIVQAIRTGIPPGRFLKKNDDGKWYDVGDRTAAEKTSQGLRERSNAEKRQRCALREALRIRRQDMALDGGHTHKKTKITNADLAAAAANHAPILNYVGTNLAVPLSLGMREAPKNTVKKRDGKDLGELNTEGLPPNAVDEDGNILVTDYDILCGRGGLTNHHKGNKRFRDIVALHRPDYVRAPKIQKPSVARVIVRAIRNGDPPGRFLRKDDKSGKWIDIGDKKAAEKTSQALREKTDEEREKLKRDPNSGVGILLPNPASYLAAATATAMFAIPATVPVPTGVPAEAAGAEAPGESVKSDEVVKEEADDNTQRVDNTSDQSKPTSTDHPGKQIGEDVQTESV